MRPSDSDRNSPSLEAAGQVTPSSADNTSASLAPLSAVAGRAAVDRRILGSQPTCSIPVIILINGPPAVGKTHMARHLEHRYGIPRFSKDEFKEAMFDVLNAPPVGAAHQFGRCAFAHLNIVMEALTRCCVPHIVEAFFYQDLAAPFLEDLIVHFRARIVQIFLYCERSVLEQRFIARQHAQDRHPCHSVLEAHHQIRESLLKEEFEPIHVNCSLVVVDTTRLDSIDYRSIYDAIEATGCRTAFEVK